MSRSTIPSKRSADSQEAAWIADEDRFVLQQAKKKAAIRVKAGRAQPIDKLTVTLAVLDSERNPLDEELEDIDLEILDPERILDGLDEDQLIDLEKGVETYVTLDSSRSNREFWTTIKTVAKDRRKESQSRHGGARGVDSVAPDLDKLLAPKSLEDLEKLEKQINAKLQSNEPIDTDYWEHLLSSLLIYKAKARLRVLSRSLMDARLKDLRRQQSAEAMAFRDKLNASLNESARSEVAEIAQRFDAMQADADERHPLDAEPLLRLRPEDKAFESMTKEELDASLRRDRELVASQAFSLHSKRSGTTKSGQEHERAAKRSKIDEPPTIQASGSLYDREVARGLNDNEEIFTAEEEVQTRYKDDWVGKYRPRKPKYFNRLITGYEWNKYNQTHYDHDNPPPKVVQGYKFNIFYPDLVDKTKAPTYRIERENGRKRGQTFAPAGENDTCLIRFMAGPPYEDVAFRIVDREWDYSAKRERGFKSSFDKGMLLLHFQFKKIYYRK